MAAQTLQDPRSAEAAAKRAAAHMDWLNIGLILVCCALAHVLPYETLVFSYAVLGPAHYLTEISWLHDRKYFGASRALVPGMATCALLLVIGAQIPQPWFVARVLLIGVGLALAAVAGWRTATVTESLTGAAYVVAGDAARPLVLMIAVFLPTVVHIFLFTGAFMLSGARKSPQHNRIRCDSSAGTRRSNFLLAADTGCTGQSGSRYLRAGVFPARRGFDRPDQRN